MTSVINEPRILTSVAGVLSLLEESEKKLQIHALTKLNEVVDFYWAEIADSLAEIEKLHEDESFSHRDLAACLASRVYYHLEDYAEALRYALGAGKLFDVTVKSQYIEKMIATCVGEYVDIKSAEYEATQKMEVYEEKVDPRLEAIVEQMLENGIHETMDTLGVAIDCRRIDKVEHIINCAGNIPYVLRQCLNRVQRLISSKPFRQEVIDLLVKLYQELPENQLMQEYPQHCLCLYYQDDADSVAKILRKLLDRQEEGVLMAHQIAFDIVDLEGQSFLRSVKQNPLLAEKAPETEEPTIEQKNLKNLHHILSGKASIELQLQFLHRNNHSDLIILDQMKAAVDQRNSILHHGSVIAHGFMQAGTTCSAYIRPNLEWFGKAANWAKVSTVASLGVIHKGNIKECMSVLSAYLNNGERQSPYSEAGALYALGLINANHSDGEMKTYLLNQLSAANNDETVQHGACLALGLLCIGENDDRLYDELKEVMFMDSAIAGEAAALAMGLLTLGTASTKATTDLLGYAHDTQHEKIIRACSLAMGMVMYRREEEADSLIEQLTFDKDALIRYGGMFAVGLAYCGTSKHSAVKKLLHVSVSDVSDDVRRAAVISLGFVLCNNPEQVPNILNLLAGSYNPHVRFAAALAIGISCAGRAIPEAMNLLLPMTSDTTNFVRQGAVIGLGFVLQQTSESAVPDVKKARGIITKFIGDKHEDVMARFGALLAAGLIDAGGRNCTASFFSNTGNLRREAVVGFCLFTQLWYWFPFIHCISLAFKPSSLIGLNKDLKIPSTFKVKCTAPVDMFAYPSPLSGIKKEEKKETIQAVLSTTAKRQAQKAKKQADSSDGTTKKTEDICEEKTEKHEDSIMETPTTDIKTEVSTEKIEASTEVLGEVKTSEELPSVEEKPKEKEDLYNNPCRVVPRQEQYIEYPADGRYKPLFENRKSGFLILRDSRSDEAEEFVEMKKETEKKEPEAPEPFEWTG